MIIVDKGLKYKYIYMIFIIILGFLTFIGNLSKKYCNNKRLFNILGMFGLSLCKTTYANK